MWDSLSVSFSNDSLRTYIPVWNYCSVMERTAKRSEKSTTLRANHPTVEVWHRMLRFHRSATTHLADDLHRHGPITFDEYDVLFQLTRARGSLRMSELADAIVAARSSCTRIVDRLTVDGLVSRSDDRDDRRVVRVSIAPEGRAALRRAAVVHLRGIDELFASHLDANDVADLERILGRLEAGQLASRTAEPT
jgi:DNA-binding MarR family transcriptional regulator